MSFTSWDTGTFMPSPYFMYFYYLCEGEALHACSSLLCSLHTSCLAYTLMAITHFMHNTPTFVRWWYFMLTAHFNAPYTLHELNLLLWMAFTSCESSTFVRHLHFMEVKYFYAFKYFMWTWNLPTLMYDHYFMTEVNFYGLPLLHVCYSPLCS